MPSPLGLLILRPDRIGDVVLTIPAIRALRAAFPRARIEALLAPATLPLAQGLPELDDAFPDPGELLPLAGRIRDRGFDLAVLPYGSWRHAAATRLAGVPRRIGNGLRAWSWLLSDRVPLHRSRPPLHEASYCMQLLAPLGIPAEPEPPASLSPPPGSLDRAGDRIEALGLTPGHFLVVHPGGGGSAGRPTPERFAELARAARDAALPDAPVLVSAGPGEEALASEVAAACEGRVLPPVEDLLDLGALLGFAGLVLAGSTGPLHLAAACGAPVLGLYPHKASQTLERWAPRGPASRGLAPDPEGCPGCEAGTCQAPACFDRVDLHRLATLAREAVAARDARERA